jgi:hypothetical protein
MDYTIGSKVMSEYLNAEIHDSIDHLEIRFEFEDRRYGLVITPEMFDLLCIDSGQDSPILAKIITNAAAWQNRGLAVGEDGFTLA